MVQPQNEAGSYGIPRDFSPEAQRLFDGPVPEPLARALGKRPGTWRETFGARADQAFNAWHTARYVDEIAAAHPGERVAVVCHGGVINVYLASVLGIDRLLWFDPVYTSVSRVLVSRDGIRSLVTLNETAHLQGVRT